MYHTDISMMICIGGRTEAYGKSKMTTLFVRVSGYNAAASMSLWLATMNRTENLASVMTNSRDVSSLIPPD